MDKIEIIVLVVYIAIMIFLFLILPIVMYHCHPIDFYGGIFFRAIGLNEKYSQIFPDICHR